MAKKGGFFRWPILVHLALIGSIIGIILFLLYNGLSTFTNHGDSVEIPDLKGLTIEQALAKLDDIELEIEVVDSLDYNPDVPKLSIMQFEPSAGERVKRGRTIYIKINPTGYRKVSFPAVLNKSLRISEVYFEFLGLKIGKIEYKDDISTDVVLEASINGEPLVGGEKLEKNSIIDLVVSKGIELKYFPAPKLLGMKYYQALKIIDSLHLNLSPVEAVIPIKDSANALVYMQSPDPGLDVSASDFFAIWITNDTVLYNSENKKWQKREKDRLNNIAKFNKNIDSIRAKERVGRPDFDAKTNLDTARAVNEVTETETEEFD